MFLCLVSVSRFCVSPSRAPLPLACHLGSPSHATLPPFHQIKNDIIVPEDENIITNQLTTLVKKVVDGEINLLKGDDPNQSLVEGIDSVRAAAAHEQPSAPLARSHTCPPPHPFTTTPHPPSAIGHATVGHAQHQPNAHHDRRVGRRRQQLQRDAAELVPLEERDGAISLGRPR